MPKLALWHSIKEDVHHNNTECTEWNNLEPEYRRKGAVGRLLCDHCRRLNKAGE